MRKKDKKTVFLIAAVLAFASATPGAGMAEENMQKEEMETEYMLEGLVLQDLDYTEDPVDIPNPDRGFYRANDGMVVPVTGTGEEATQMEECQEPVTVGGAQVTTRVSHVYFDLRNFSDNALTGAGVPYDEDYYAPEDVSIRSSGIS